MEVGFSGDSRPSEADREEDLGRGNAPLSDEDLDRLLPSTDSYAIVSPPAGWAPPPRATPAPVFSSLPFQAGKSSWDCSDPFSQPQLITIREDLPKISVGEIQRFQRLILAQREPPNDSLGATLVKIEENLLVFVKGTASQWASSEAILSDCAIDIGPARSLDILLPAFITTGEENNETRWTRLLTQIFARFGELLRPYAHKILVVLEPILLDQLVSTRDCGRDLVRSVARAVGIDVMLAAKRPDMDNADAYVRNITARTLSIAAAEFGVSRVLPFIRTASQDEISPLLRHTGIKIIQQIALLLDSACAPFLSDLLGCLRLSDSEPSVRTISFLSLIPLADAANGVHSSSFGAILPPLWSAIGTEKDRLLHSVLKACGHVLALIPDELVLQYSSVLLPPLLVELERVCAISDTAAMTACFVTLGKFAIRCEYCRSLLLNPETLDRLQAIVWSRHVCNDRRVHQPVAELVGALILYSTLVLDSVLSALSSEDKFLLALACVEQFGTRQAPNLRDEGSGGNDIECAILQQIAETVALLVSSENMERAWRLLSALAKLLAAPRVDKNVLARVEEILLKLPRTSGIDNALGQFRRDLSGLKFSQS